ncbi:hypothetical protein Emag_000749 [Eimeria magna]
MQCSKGSPLLLLLLLCLGSSPPSVSALKTRGSARVLDSVKAGEAAAASNDAADEAAEEGQHVTSKQIADSIKKITEGIKTLWRKAKEAFGGSETEQSEEASSETSTEETKETEETGTKSAIHSKVKQALSGIVSSLKNRLSGSSREQ